VLTEVLRGFSEYRLWVYTLVLFFIVFFMPQGLVAPLWRRIRAVT
jgi:branched-chain amino acid transport system permease protein